MALILSIDVGLRNLAFCIAKKSEVVDVDICLWDVYNTLESSDSGYTCQCLQMNKKVCGRKCTMKYNYKGQVIYTCKRHFPTSTITATAKNKITIKKVDSYLLQDIAKRVLKKIQDVYDENKELFNSVTQVLIELQPKVNQKMKFVSHIIYGKLVELLGNATIRFVRASQKLKAYKGPYLECNLKNKYASKKWASIQYTMWFLNQQKQSKHWIDFFDTSPKKDDLGDVFLMCINGLNGLSKSQTKSKKGKCIK